MSSNPHPLRSLDAVTLAIQARASRPLLTLAQSLLQLGLVSLSRLRQLELEDPHLLRDRCGELVRRGEVRSEDLFHALALVAGVIEVDVKAFEVQDSEHGRYLPLASCRDLKVVPLGLANETLFVASFHPTSEVLHRSLCQMTGHSVSLLWASRQEIESRLDRGPEVPTLEWDPAALSLAIKR